MNRRCLHVFLALGLLLISRNAHGWWETWLTTVRPVPLVKEIEAETCREVSADMLRSDPQADGGRGGKAVLLTPGGVGLTTEVEVPPGIYELMTIARHPEGKVGEWRAGHDLMSLEVKELASGQIKSWTMIVVYREEYFAVGQMFFPAYAGGRYTVTLKLADRLTRKPPESVLKTLSDESGLGLKARLEPLLVDRLELRDALGNCARKGAKTSRMMTSDRELEMIRKEFAKEYAKRADKRLTVGGEAFTLTGDMALASYPNGRTAGERRERNEQLWSTVPDFNEHCDMWGKNPYSALSSALEFGTSYYEKTGNPELAWDAAVLLCALAAVYPAQDSLAQGTGWAQSNLSSGSPFRFRNISYNFWMNPSAAYDRVFDFIKGNKALAEYVGTRIPGIKTPDDVVRLLDVNLLQTAMDKANRSYQILWDEMARIPLVQGVNDVSDRMLENGLFRKAGIDAPFGGGVEDTAFSGHYRDGLRYIGSSCYSTDALLRMGEDLYRRWLAGGSPRFLLDPKRYPPVYEADRTLYQLHMAGGFFINYGDASRPGRSRALRGGTITSLYHGDVTKIGKEIDIAGELPDYPSRVVGGVGVSILESGESKGDPDQLRAVGLHYGIGRGHAHHDTLNIEFFAHGVCMSQDLGRRHDQGHGCPNMIWNRVHNVVEVDERNFKNDYPGSATCGTGWNTSFEPMPGAQYMEHYARATSHPNVSLYARQTAMIDVGDADSYYFDVFRVKGGKTHTYCFHGCETRTLGINTELRPAEGAAKEYLSQHYPGTRQEGEAPSMLEVDWAADPTRVGAAYTNRIPTTRLTVFGNMGAKVLVGNAWSPVPWYRYNYPFLYVQWKQEQEGRESVFPSVIEPFAGKPFLGAKRVVSVSPGQTGADAAVGLEVKTADGRVDLLYESVKPDEMATLDGKVKVAGKFALISKDGAGLRMAALAGGTTLECEDVILKAEKRAYRPRVADVRYDDLSFTVDEELPARLLRGAVANLGGNEMLSAFTLTHLNAADGRTRVVHDKTAKYYQSAITRMDEKNETVGGELEPSVVGCDTEFINGTTVSNEKQDRFWKATMKEGDRWMHVGFPGYRGSHMNKTTLEDFPDVDGDGRRTLKLIGIADNSDKERAGMEIDANDPISGKITVPDAMELVEPDPPEKVGKTLVELEVSAVRADGETFDFKLPQDDHYRRGGYQYVGRPLVNEAGRTNWLAFYPGSTFLFKLEGGFRAGEFTDADKDGKVKMAAYLFGPGDRMNVDTYVYARRQSAGVYEIRANVACEVGVPRGEFNKAEISMDGMNFSPVIARLDGSRLLMTLSEKDLADGRILLRLTKE